MNKEVKHPAFVKIMLGPDTPLANQPVRPILFSTPMVEAVLDGRKSQTRRLIKTQPKGTEGNAYWWKDRHYASRGHLAKGCPYGQPGDLLWVRETWANWEGALAFKAGKVLLDARGREYNNDDHDEITRLKLWKSALHLHMASSRILLQITNVRAELVQEISEEDAQAEGAEKMHLDDLGQTWMTYQRGFQSIWDGINGKTKGAAWADNPWVWAITFKRLKP